MKLNIKNLTIFLLLFFFFLANCIKFKPVDARDNPTNALERARKNVNEGRGVSIKNLGKGMRGTNYEFSSSNPMWRSSLEVLDFLPLSVVDYSGGVIITDWYNDSSSANESLKITVRFLSNEIRSDSLKIIVHKKNCLTPTTCSTKIIDSRIKNELLSTIIKKAAKLNLESKNKKK